MGKSTISMAIFHSYVKLPEGIGDNSTVTVSFLAPDDDDKKESEKLTLSLEICFGLRFTLW